MKKTTILLIRHGHTVGGEEKRYKGHIDVELSPEGESQIRSLKQRFNGLIETTNAVYCSDLKRAIRSAEIISEGLDITPVIVPEFRERSFGIWEGMSFEEIEKAFPREFNLWKSDPLNYSPPGGESTMEVQKRTIEALGRLLNQHRGDTISIVAHGGINRVILCHFMGIPLSNIFRIEQNFGCLNIIDLYDDGVPVVRLVNG